MTGSVQVYEPGSIRSINYRTKLGEDGKYPVTYWGTIDEQIAEATKANLEQWTCKGHDQVQLYTFTDNCPHTNPEDDEKYEGVDDLLDAWKERNLFGLTWRDGDLYHKNVKRGEQIIPEYAAWAKAQDEWEDGHSSDVCLLSPDGVCCASCEADSLEYGEGTEPGPCSLPYRAREAWDEFWSEFTVEAFEDREREANRV